MRTVYVVHIVAGSLGLIFGYLALYAAKGATLHRRAGMVFVYAMLTMCVAGVAIAAVRSVAPALNIPAGLITGYLVITSLTTVRPPAARLPWLERSLVLLAVGVGIITLTFGLEAIANGGTRNGMPAFPFFMFGIVGVLGAAGDLRVMRSGALTGARRLARHLWRMSFALFIAAMSFFIGQARVIPEPIRIMPLLALPVVAVLATMLYWMWRIRVKRSLRGIAVVGAREAVPVARPAA
ncbi:MAG TPA: hypothetical protein VJ596_12130 [Gemmatimonadaceae bacterium]|nr:hypothetical protein [Gemmatimonadaceae bacterium]